MKTKNVLLSTGLVACIGLISFTLPRHNLEAFEVGIGLVDISGEEAEILDPLQVKAMVFRQGNEWAAIVECDVSGVGSEVTNPAREQAAVATGIPYENICVAATHTHMYNPHKELVPAIVEALTRAKEAVEPVKMQSAIGQEFTVAFNRRYYMKDGSVAFNPMFLNPDIVRPVGPIDADLVFTLFSTKKDGMPSASISNYALHLDIVKEYGAVYQKTGKGSRNTVSADYPYFIEQSLREEFGADFNSLFLTGCCGNINHWDFSKPGPQSGYEKSRQVGEALGAAIKDALPKLKNENPALAVRTRIVEVPLQSYTPEDLKWAQAMRDEKLSSKSEEMSERQLFLDNRKMQRILWLEEQKQEGKVTMDIEVQVFRLGNNTAIVTLPGEMFVEHGLTIKNMSPFDNTMVMELSNNSVGYVPNRLAFKQGGYEVENSRLAPGGAEMLVKAAVEMLIELKTTI